MTQVITITSKRQITIPAVMFKALKLKQGQKIIISKRNNVLALEPIQAKIDKLAGSINIPSRFKKMPIEDIVKKAKQEYFQSKRK